MKNSKKLSIGPRRENDPITLCFIKYFIILCYYTAKPIRRGKITASHILYIGTRSVISCHETIYSQHVQQITPDLTYIAVQDIRGSFAASSTVSHRTYRISLYVSVFSQLDVLVVFFFVRFTFKTK